MQIANCEFEEGRPRTLAVALADGLPVQATAELKSIIRHPTHEARFFQLAIGNLQFAIVRVQLNGPSTGSGRADDEARLAEIAADLLSSPVPNGGCEE